MADDPSHLYLPSSRGRKTAAPGQLDLFVDPAAAPRVPPRSEPKPAPAAPPPPPPEPAAAKAPLFSKEPDALRDWTPHAPLPLHRHLEDNPLFQKPDPAATRDVITHREGKPPLVTGIYRKPRTPSPHLTLDISRENRLEDEAPTPGTLPSIPEIFRAVRAYFAAAPFPPWMAVSVLVAIPVVFLLAWLSIPRPRTPAAPTEPAAVAETAAPAPEVPAADTSAPEAGTDLAASGTPAPETPAVEAPPPAAPSAETVALAQKFQFKNARASANADGSISVVFDLPVFVSSAYLSPDGMKLLKSAAANLKTVFPKGARVSVMGHTDDTPPSGNTPGLKSNDDIALARAQAAAEQLVYMTGHDSRYAISAVPPSSPPVYPFPNDTAANRRLNRTVTLRIAPPPAAP